jgi:hypothetical protein
MGITYNGYKRTIYTLMTTKTTTTALILTIFALVGGAIIPTGVVVPTPVAYAQLSDVDDIVDDSLETVGIIEEEEEAEEDSNIEQEPVDQEVGQEGISQSKDFDGRSTNIQIQSRVDEQDTAHEIVNNNDFSESNSELGYAMGKYSSFTYSSTDAEKANEQNADNDGELNLDEEQTVDQDDTSIFADDAADLDPANVATSIAMPVYVQVQEEVVEEEP